MGTISRDEANSKEYDGANILPIPPALKFPFPSQNRGTQDPSVGPLAKMANSQKAAGRYGQPSTSTPAANLNPSPVGHETQSANTPAREEPSETGGPTQSHTRSRFGIGRRHTRNRRAPPEEHAWQSDVAADSSSSSDDDDSNGTKKRRSDDHKAAGGEKKGFRAGAKSSRLGDFSRFAIGNENFKTRGKVSKTSGRLDISLNEIANRGYLAKALGSSLQHREKQSPKQDENGTPGLQPSSVPGKRPTSRPDLWTRLTSFRRASAVQEKSIPVLNIVVMVIGSRGDIQPFLKIGKLLKERGHRVRIATHPAFKTFVEQDSDLEFFSVGGDPAELMAFMVKNPGLMPSASTIRAGEIGKKRDSMFEMFQGFWRACINATDEEGNVSNLKMMDDKHPFVADAIIANPPSFAHIHCAERLGIPLHLMFTFPYSPTQQFPHPLANIKQTNVDTNYTNFISYPLVEMMYANLPFPWNHADSIQDMARFG